MTPELAHAQLVPDPKPVWRRAIVSALARSYQVALTRDPRGKAKGLYAFGDAALVEAVAALYVMYGNLVEVLSAQRAATADHPTVVDRYSIKLVRSLFSTSTKDVL